ncbi:MAG TPA: hypothetical protein IAB17_06170 [Candidatus Alectryocaccobium stercorigallinarum]|nr:hypothetical protein [Candidatus Alectryocaccobium stercorigallinarum]
MPGDQKEIYVYDDFSFDKPTLLGMLFVNSRRGVCGRWYKLYGNSGFY